MSVNVEMPRAHGTLRDLECRNIERIWNIERASRR